MEKENLPITLTANEIAQVLGISKRIAYEVMKYPGFPLTKIGRYKKVNRDAFFKWYEQQSN